MSDGNDPIGAVSNPVIGFDRVSPVVSEDATTRMPSAPVKATDQPVTMAELEGASLDLALIVKEVSDTDLSFSVERELNKLVVVVRAVGSDEVIRQFPPEEFITVAKYIAQQNPDQMSDEMLKGILFDNYT